MPTPILTLKAVSVNYGATEAVRSVSLSLVQGQIGGLIGANGAGKSSTLGAISGTVKNSIGSITFDGRELTQLSVHGIVREGVSQVPEGRRVFAELSVIENLEVGRFVRRHEQNDREIYDYVYQLFPILFNRRSQFAGSLSGGEQQMLAVARALMSEPRLIMLDEPSLGLAPKIVDTIFDSIVEIASKGVTVLIVEQNVARTFDVADVVWVLDRGEITVQGSPNDLRHDPRVIEAYLGATQTEMETLEQTHSDDLSRPFEELSTDRTESS